MKSKVVERISSETPQEVKDEVKKYANKIISMKNKTAEQLAEEYAEEQNSAYTNDYYGFLAGFSARKEIEQKILLDTLNKYKSHYQQQTQSKMDRGNPNFKYETELLAKIEVIHEIQNKLK